MHENTFKKTNKPGVKLSSECKTISISRYKSLSQHHIKNKYKIETWFQWCRESGKDPQNSSISDYDCLIHV